jgi:hypothetical protein
MPPFLSPVLVRVINLPSSPSDWPSVVSCIATVLALFISVAAYVLASKANRTIADERRKVFELEILRDLLLAIENGGEVFNLTTPGLVNALPPKDLPLWRELIELRGDGDQPDDFARRTNEILNKHEIQADLGERRLPRALAKDIHASMNKRLKEEHSFRWFHFWSTNDDNTEPDDKLTGLAGRAKGESS